MNISTIGCQPSFLGIGDNLFSVGMVVIVVVIAVLPT